MYQETDADFKPVKYEVVMLWNKSDETFASLKRLSKMHYNTYVNLRRQIAEGIYDLYVEPKLDENQVIAIRKFLDATQDLRDMFDYEN